MGTGPADTPPPALRLRARQGIDVPPVYDYGFR
jgi:hypothetical protein